MTITELILRCSDQTEMSRKDLCLEAVEGNPEDDTNIGEIRNINYEHEGDITEGTVKEECRKKSKTR